MHLQPSVVSTKRFRLDGGRMLVGIGLSIVNSMVLVCCWVWYAVSAPQRVFGQVVGVGVDVACFFCSPLFAKLGGVRQRVCNIRHIVTRATYRSVNCCSNFVARRALSYFFPENGWVLVAKHVFCFLPVALPIWIS